MHYDVNTEPISTKRIISDICQEVPVDLDFTLPDYCPDIQKILKCIVTPNITYREISGDRLNIEGNTSIRVIYYEGENNGLRVCENSSPFSTQIDLHASPENAVTITKIKTGYVNCRAVSPRKIDIHGAFSLCNTVTEKVITEITNEILGDDINQKTKKFDLSNLVALSEQQFTVSDVLEIDENKPPIEMILNTSKKLIINSCKPSENAVNFEGEIILKVLYLSDIETSQTEVLEYSIPVVQTFDIPGVTEDSDIVASGEILSSNIKFSVDENSSAEESEFKCSLVIEAYQNHEFTAINDAYSTDSILDLSSSNIKFSNLLMPINENFSTKTSIESSDHKISEILDIWSCGLTQKAQCENDKIIFSGKLNICILATDFDKIPFYFERTLDFSHEKNVNDFDTENARVECEITPVSLGYRITGENSVEIKSDYKINANLFQDENQNIVVGATTSESAPIQRDTEAGMIIYFAEKDENVWDIASKYHTKPESITSENDLQSDIIEQNMALLIPIA